MLLSDRDGRLSRSWLVWARQVRQITVAGDFLWVTDPGSLSVALFN